MVLDAPAQVSLFTYDNDVFCVYPYACDGCAAQRIRVRVRGIAKGLRNLSNARWSVKPLYTTRSETIFELMTQPGDFVFYAIDWAENRDGEAEEELTGSAPHEFDD